MVDVSRRGFLGGVAAAAAATALPAPLREVKPVQAVAPGGFAIGDSFTIEGVYASGTRQLQRFFVAHLTPTTFKIDA